MRKKEVKATIVWYNQRKGYGQLELPDGELVMFAYVQFLSLKSLKPGKVVKFSDAATFADFEGE